MNIKKYELNKDLAFDHFCKSVNNSNELSRNVFNLLDLKKNGCFFTFLSSEEEFQHIHNFTLGGLTTIPKEMIINFLVKKLLSNQGYCLIFDDVFEDYKSLSGYHLFESNGLHYENEAYYLINSKEHPNSNLVRECLRASDTEWHCLGVLSLIDYEGLKNKIMTLEMIHDICINAEIILTTAYDGEGYIFWEKTE